MAHLSMLITEPKELVIYRVLREGSGCLNTLSSAQKTPDTVFALSECI